MKRLISLVDSLNHTIGIAVSFLLLPLIAVTCYEVFVRYVLGDPTTWSYDIGYMLTGALFVLGIALTLREQAHIRIDVLYSRFNKKHKKYADLFAYLVCGLPICLWLSWELWDYVIEAYQRDERSGQSAWNPIIWPFRLCFFVGFVSFSLQLLSEALKNLTDTEDNG